ncbi:MAG TPA: TldD/PmbA family protein [Planctomycetota bacterium]|nr:TldD/PmbA family protein [Planctomycetota bacterium]
MILSEPQARDLIGKVLSLASADEVRVNLSGGRTLNTRFAVNTVSTCGDRDDLSIAVTAWFGKRHATASASETDDESLQRLVATAEEMARVAPEDPEYVPELAPQEYLPIRPWFESTAKAGSELGAEVARSAIEPAAERNITVAGYLEYGAAFRAVGNHKGIFGYYESTDANYSVTARTADGKGSGWASDNSRDIAELDYAAASARAIAKAEASQKPKTLQPGVYPVILEPAAVDEFLAYALWSMNARQADEGRSFFAKKGGGNKIGEKVVGENITMESDPTRKEILGAPFGGDGLPAKPYVWIKNGVLQRLFYDRYWAHKQGKEPTGWPSNLIFQGGKGTLDDLIAATEKALLVTRFWYIRSLDPQTILVTGLTRDGVFWVEDGAIRHAVKNFRFNETPIAVLSKVTGMSKPMRFENSLLPALRASEFTFSSLSDAV